MGESINETSQFLESKNHFQGMAESLIKQNGLTFDEYLERNPELLRLASIGDGLISKRECTGYNVLDGASNMDLLSPKRLLFFNFYSYDTANIASLLARLVTKRIISASQIHLGIKASKVIYADWILSPNEKKENLFQDNLGESNNPVVSKTLETVITFMPASGNHAKKIFKEITNFIIWEFPDLRATMSLEFDLPKRIFKPVQANLLIKGDSQLVVLREKTSFEDINMLSDKWSSRKILLNKELAEFLTKYGVKP